MLNFAEQTGSGAVIFVWSFLIITLIWKYINILQSQSRKTLTTQSKVTGDRWSVARRVAREMGCTEVQAEAMPADKLKLVDALKSQGRRVAVAGDGVNDAPALAAGDLSIAMGAAGSDVAINSASIVLMNNNLNRLGFLIRLSRKTTGVIHQSLIFGLGFVVVFMILAGMGFLNAIAGALLHLLAAAFVILNSARLVRLGEELQEAEPQETAAPQVRLEPVPAT